MIIRIAKKTASLLSGLAVLGLAGYAGLLVAGYRPTVVYSGSMVPQLKVGSLAMEKPVPASTVKVGDVVTFKDPFVPGRLVTHRVIRIFHTSHGLAYRTKGDANPARDPWTIALPDKVGRVSFDVPYIGYALVYTRTREIRTIFIALGILSTLGGILWKIWKPRPEREEQQQQPQPVTRLEPGTESR
jgi:signal peptidase I